MNSASERRGVTYSAEAAGDRGDLRCHVVRRPPLSDGRGHYTIVVDNQTNVEAQALAFVPETSDQPYRTIVQTIVAPHAEFSTTVTLERARYGAVPEFHVALSAGDSRFTLSLPSVPAPLALPANLSDGSAALAAIGSGPESRALVPRNFQSHFALQPTPEPARPIAAPMFGYAAKTTPRTSPAIAPVLAVFAALVVLAGIFVGRPRILALVVPQRVWANVGFPISYNATGLGAADLTVIGPDGESILTRPVTLGARSVALQLPSRPVAAAYRVRLRIDGLLGSASAENYVRVASPTIPPVARERRPRRVAPPAHVVAAAATPQIRSFALDRSTLTSGDTLNVYYDVVGSGGTLSLIDPAAQITYARGPLSATGRTALVAPRTDVERSLTVVLVATNGRLTTQSRVAVNLVPLDATADKPQVEPTTAADESGAAPVSVGKPSGTAIFAPPAVRSGRPIRVNIRGASAGLQVVLLDGLGTELARRDVASGKSSVIFTAPTVRVPTRFLFEATNPRGIGSETIVRPIAVEP